MMQATIQVLLNIFGTSLMLTWIVWSFLNGSVSSRRDRWFQATGFVVCLNSFIASASVGHKPGMVVNAAGMAWFAYRLWKNDHTRRKRRKLLERANGYVRDIGGRLKVILPAPSH